LCYAAAAQIADIFIYPLAGGWPKADIIQGFGRAADNPPFNVDTGWFEPYHGYHLGYDVTVHYSQSDILQKNYRQALAPANGVVRFAQTVLGYTVIIEHTLPSGDPDGPAVCSVFYHMLRPKDGGVALTPGQVVSIGDVIGYVSPLKIDHQSVPHQHFGIRKGAYRSGLNPRTGYWFYPGYSSIKGEYNPQDPLHGVIISEWFNPALFLQRHSGTVTITPSAATLPEDGIQTFSATITGNGFVNWSVQEGPAGGSVTSSGIYTPPASTGLFHVVATNSVDPSKSATATVLVIPPLSYTVLHAFPSQPNAADGVYPSGPLVQASDGNFYGTTGQGGFCVFSYYSGCGVLFKLDSVGNFSVVHTFGNPPDGVSPSGALIQVMNGALYGVTTGGGTNGYTYPYNGGTAFSYVINGNETVLHSFIGSDGDYPAGGMIIGTDGYFYGTTDLSTNILGIYGTVFKMDFQGSVTPLHFFNGSGSDSPVSNTPPLVRMSDGTLYGVTAGGISFGNIFRIDATGSFSILHAFAGPDGISPHGLVLGQDGALYGVATGGGTSPNCYSTYTTGCGTIFKIDTTGAFTVLHQFSGTDGQNPINIYRGPDGYFYGATYGMPRGDMVFRFDMLGNITLLHSTGGSNGYYPSAGVILATDGKLYGTQNRGGPNGGGVVFQLSLP
jgi:uncharacterized repeat protein (TIGR03803 family)